MKIKQYTALTDNLFRQLAKGYPVRYNNLLLKVEEGKIVVKGELDNKNVELHYWLKKGNHYGFSKEQFKNILASREKPMFSVSISGRLNKS
jgi:hypothetical protein